MASLIEQFRGAEKERERKGEDIERLLVSTFEEVLKAADELLDREYFIVPFDEMESRVSRNASLNDGGYGYPGVRKWMRQVVPAGAEGSDESPYASLGLMPAGNFRAFGILWARGFVSLTGVELWFGTTRRAEVFQAGCWDSPKPESDQQRLKALLREAIEYDAIGPVYDRELVEILAFWRLKSVPGRPGRAAEGRSPEPGRSIGFAPNKGRQ